MAGSNDDVSNRSKPVKPPTEKKKRKRPSKKVPTTVLQANSSGFMHLVQKLTGSAEELAGESSNPSPNQSPHSSPSHHDVPNHAPTSETSPETHYDPYAGYSSGLAASYSSPGYSYSSPPPPTSFSQDAGYQSTIYGYGGYGGYGGSGGYADEGGRGSAHGGGGGGEQDDNSQGHSSYGHSYGGGGGGGGGRSFDEGSDRYNNNYSPSSSARNDVWRDSMNRNPNSDHYYWYYHDLSAVQKLFHSLLVYVRA